MAAGESGSERASSEAAEVPEFIAPMLAEKSEPFDSAEHLFEVKWDGTRALAFVTNGEARLVNRRRASLNARYPELDSLRKIPPGTVLDGEIVVLHEGRPDFGRLLSRDESAGGLRSRLAAKTRPATFVVFDLLHAEGRSLLDEAIETRRERLRELLARSSPELVEFSEGVVGEGRSYFDACVSRGLEGVVAKRLGSRYSPGKRTRDWLKIKPLHEVLCAIIGWVENDTGGLRSLVIAESRDGELVEVGKVGSGLDDAMRTRLEAELPRRARRSPLVPSGERAHWVEPGLFCRVSYLERTARGHLRGPVFRGLIEAQ